MGFLDGIGKALDSVGKVASFVPGIGQAVSAASMIGNLFEGLTENKGDDKDHGRQAQRDDQEEKVKNPEGIIKKISEETGIEEEQVKTMLENLALSEDGKKVEIKNKHVQELITLLTPQKRESGQKLDAAA